MLDLTYEQQLYNEFIATARCLIQQYGQQIKIQKLIAGAAVDATKPWRQGANTVVTIGTIGAFFPNAGIRNPHTRQRKKKMDVSEGALMGYIPSGDLFAQGYRLDDTDVIVLADGTTWKVTSVDDMNPTNGQAIYYEVRLAA